MRQWGKIGLKNFLEIFSHDPDHGGDFPLLFPSYKAMLTC
jgi:hypothetical protein